MSKESWGWNSSLEKEYQNRHTDGLEAGRVIKEVRHLYTVASETSSASEEYLKGEVSGAFQFKAAGPADYPAIGDWVLYRRASEDKLVIEDVLPRWSSFSRKVAGDRTDEQVLAANIDIIYLVFGINGGRNFTSGGLERYMTLAWESGATPVIILNKADLCTEDERETAQLTAENAAPGVEIHMISAVTEEGLNEMTSSLKPGMTIGLTGPSGVGKSTIINSLAGVSLQKTTSQREGDLRGRHTTTHKEMFRLPSGVIMVDTPGLKEVQLWADEDSLAETFQDITKLAQNCRFRDCSHQGEPGCAVQSALASGELENRRYENYLVLQKELKYLKTRQETSAARLEREKWKHVAQFVKSPMYSAKRKKR
ncbi:MULTISPECIES: ribosome small subunit-dependent GTPase A [unclassified Oceanispirochaeta]|uniref:ribosome small subunit-dependent GTPase A n=1 Tax=unclassified Oceanispirochaeta TaxID=2635722 RepID=UPI000E094483|nr:MULTISPECIES: ribosome small subunit-dependent GTPase A [unclassified Oceanispirochaeta]MBF9017905.1 ribosome small subunit-dependent GTPase A [Oceanispirochaeta sp. M2]NPD74416.1 ribosome small subunit-dependent GTPase A [Oceanispirochaeta sp. M1]RDG29717.1 ribosome small subunit-dependent GTPase A [Oceanispirochaeta sp. M1]